MFEFRQSAGRFKIVFLIVFLMLSFGLWAQEFDLTAFDEEFSYQGILKEYEEKDYRPTVGVSIEIPALSYSDSSDFGIKAEEGAPVGGGAKPDPNYPGRPVLWWDEEESWVEYEVDIPKSGLYNIQVSYYQLEGKRHPIRREILIDGEYPFREAKAIEIPRIWKDKNKPVQDNQGNDVRPRQEEVQMWRTQILLDTDGDERGAISHLLDCLADLNARLERIPEPELEVRAAVRSAPPGVPLRALPQPSHDLLGLLSIGPGSQVRVDEHVARWAGRRPIVRLGAVREAGGAELTTLYATSLLAS